MNNMVDNLNKTQERLYRKFLRVFKMATTDNREQQQCYAELLEVIRNLIISCNVRVSEVGKCAESQPITWYKQMIPKEQAILNSKIELMQRFSEFINAKSQEVKVDIVKELFVSFRGLLNASGLKFNQIEQLRRERQEIKRGVSSTNLTA